MRPLHDAPSTGLNPEQVLRTCYPGIRLLWVDDDDFNQELAQCMLEPLGLTLDLASHGAQAVQMVQQNHYAVILMNIQMPVMDGLEATRQIRRLPGHGQTPIIAMTAHAQEQDQQQCRDAGMNDCLTKPVFPDVLYAVLLKNLTALAIHTRDNHDQRAATAN